MTTTLAIVGPVRKARGGQYFGTKRVQNKRARKAGAPGNLTQRDIELFWIIFGRRCLRCGSTDQISIDHVVPLSKAGSNTLDNLQPLCRPCNNLKGSQIADYRVRRCA